jgi:hypothetical protein
MSNRSSENQSDRPFSIKKERSPFSGVHQKSDRFYL